MDISADNHLVVGSTFTVTVAVTNAGTSAAYGVKVDDSEVWDAEAFSVVDGSLQATFEKVDVGETVEHTFAITPTGASGETEKKISGALVSYNTQPQAAGDDIEGYSTGVAVAQIVSASAHRTAQISSFLSTYTNNGRIAYPIIFLSIVYYILKPVISGEQALKSGKRKGL